METIRIPGPYNFDQVLSRHALDPLNVVNMEERSIKVPLMIDNTPKVFQVQATGTVDQPEFLIKGTDDKVKKEAVKKLSRIFQWDIPLRKIHCHFEGTDLRPIFETFRGMPLILDFDLYSSLVGCIISQQLNMSFARTLTERFVKTFGTQMDGVYFYPSPEKVAGLKVEDFRQLQFSGRKAEYIIGVAQAISSGALNLDEFYEKTDEEIKEELIKLRGVGQWTVENFLLFGLGRPNLFPLADIGIQKALQKLYGLDRKPTYEEMDSYKRAWEPYLSYASLYLWRSIE